MNTLKFIAMSQLQKMSSIKFGLYVLKHNFPTYEWFCADGLEISFIYTEPRSTVAYRLSRGI